MQIVALYAFTCIEVQSIIELPVGVVAHEGSSIGIPICAGGENDTKTAVRQTSDSRGPSGTDEKLHNNRARIINQFDVSIICRAVLNRQGPIADIRKVAQ